MADPALARARAAFALVCGDRHPDSFGFKDVRYKTDHNPNDDGTHTVTLWIEECYACSTREFHHDSEGGNLVAGAVSGDLPLEQPLPPAGFQSSPNLLEVPAAVAFPSAVDGDDSNVDDRAISTAPPGPSPKAFQPSGVGQWYP